MAYDFEGMFYASISDGLKWEAFLSNLVTHRMYRAELPNYSHEDWREKVAKGVIIDGYWEWARQCELDLLNCND